MKYSQVKEIIKAGYRDELASLLNDYDEDVIFGYFDNTAELDNFEEAYQGKYSTDGDFTRQLICDTEPAINNLPSYICIDWDTTADDIMMEFFEVNGCYFRSI